MPNLIGESRVCWGGDLSWAGGPPLAVQCVKRFAESGECVGVGVGEVLLIIKGGCPCDKDDIWGARWVSQEECTVFVEGLLNLYVWYVVRCPSVPKGLLAGLHMCSAHESGDPCHPVLCLHLPISFPEGLVSKDVLDVKLVIVQ